jgi:ribose-phosphate pyrophosphokinase
MGKFERIRYPDGQIGAVWKGENPPPADNRWLMIRINSYEDLFYVRAIAEVLDYHNVRNWKLYIPCMFGQRSDRRFTEFQSFDLRLICDIINECKFERVSILDPHSDMTMGLINKSTKHVPDAYIKEAIADIRQKQKLDGKRELVLVSPDAGAYKKVQKFGKEAGISVVGALKGRDGSDISLTFTHDVTDKDCLIVDDLCDGGRTFIILADQLRKHGAKRVYLYVSHGLFSKGFMELHKYIDHIYTTNSVKDLENAPIHEEVEWADWHQGHLPMRVPEVYDFVTQFKVIWNDPI